MNSTDLISFLYQKKSWDDRLTGPFLSLGFEDPKTAWRNLTALGGQVNFEKLYPTFFPSFLEFLGQSYNADLACNNFERLAEKIHDKENLYARLTQSSEFLRVLLILFSGSQVLTDTLLNDPSHLDWLSQPETLTESKTRDRLYREFYAMAAAREGNTIPSLLRRFKKREYIRIGLRDLLGLVELAENVESLSDLADVCLQVAFEFAYETTKKKYGIPVYEDADGRLRESEFTILSMGKLGGRELNYSSDIDLIYIYTSSMGETQKPEAGPQPALSVSNHEFHTRQAQALTQALHEITSEGNVFRVDLNLRPEGQNGEIVNSLTSCETYYQSWGKTWERQAMIKARVSAGSEALGNDFFAMIRPFVYRRSLDFHAIEEVKALKKKMDLQLKQKNQDKGNIKLGFGGIREIEFIVQSYQLLFGGRDPSLRNPNTLENLQKLHDRKFLSTTEYQRLQAAYIFLRNLENRVQITFGLQTYRMPKEERDLDVLAKKMCFKEATPQERISHLQNEFEHHTQFVGNMFAGLFVDDADQKKADQLSRNWSASRDWEERFSPEFLKDYGFRDPQRTFKFLKSLQDGPPLSHPTEKSIQTFYSLLPSLLRLCQQVPDRNRAVENLVKFIEASHAREAYLGIFQENEKFLELLLILFGGSETLSDILIKYPNLIDVLSNPESLYRFKTPESISRELSEVLEKTSSHQEMPTSLRRFKQGEELRIGLRYLIHETELPGTLTDLSDLAEIYLQKSFMLACQEVGKEMGLKPIPDQMAIMALGKLGGRELNFSSDLDIIFVYDESSGTANRDAVTFYSAVAQKVYQLCSEMTSAGTAYKIDTDLRPEGSGGSLVHSLQGYEKYFKSRGQIWEQQAMTRTRWVAGNPKVGEKFLEVAQAFTYRPKLDYGSLIEISRMRERMEKELAHENKKGKNVKLGFGGLADIEFILQILQLMHGHRYPKLRATNTLEVMDVLSGFGILQVEQAEALRIQYKFLRNLECALRLTRVRASSHLPKDDESLGVLARLLGYQDESERSAAGQLRQDYAETTQEVRKFYRAHLGTLLRTSL